MKVLEKFMQKSSHAFTLFGQKSSDMFTFLMQMSGQTLQMNYKTNCFHFGNSCKSSFLRNILLNMAQQTDQVVDINEMISQNKTNQK